MGEFRMPSLGADMTEGTLLEWHIKPGDAVHRGDVVAVVDTDKAAIEVEVFEDGVVDRLLVPPGTRVPVGTPLATLHDGAAAPEVAPAPVAEPAVEPPVGEPVPVAVGPLVESPLVRHLAHTTGVDLTALPGTGPGGAITRADVEAAAAAAAPTAWAAPAAPVVPVPVRPRATPLARRRAAELGVDLSTVTGTGPDGAVTEADLRAAPAAEERLTAAPPATTTAPTSSADRIAAMRRAIGALMARSKREVPHYYLSATIDLSAVTAWLRDTNAGRSVEARLVPAAVLLKAVAIATRAVPEVNGYWVDDHLEVSERVHLGVAVSLRPSGLVAPAILDADTLDLDTLMARLRDLVTRARTGRLRQQEMTAGTLTVTNLGDNGVESVFGVIYPPQVALVGLGRIAERPWASGGMLGVRPCVTATLSGDHRASDGHRGSRYLTALDDILQRPEEL